VVPQDAVTSLEELLKAVARQRSLRGRLRVLGHSWQLLRSLTPAEREKVALRMGSSWAWKRLEKSFLRDGQLDDNERMLGRILERMGDSDPEELRELASTLRSGDRAAGKDLLMMTLKEALEEEATEEEHRLEELVEVDAAEPEAGPDPEPELVATPQGVLASSPAETVATAEASESDAPEVPEPPPAPAPPRAPSPSIPPRPPRQRTETPDAPRPTEDEARPVPVGFAGGLERLRVLRSLQHDPEPGAALGRAGRAELIDALGEGWAARRALSRMITAGSLDDLDEALALIARLGRAGQQTWCLADLIASWDLDAAARRRVLDAAPSDAVRRRLARRGTRHAAPARTSLQVSRDAGLAAADE
jgi:hypothetical protein